MPKMDKRLIAFCGTRGIPANYGGFETAVEEISRRFHKKGYNCEVYCRDSNENKEENFNGIKLTYVPGSKRRSLDTFLSSIQTGLILLRNRKDYKHVFWFNNANLPGILLTKLAGIPMSINTDGLEWRRSKWTWPFKSYYFLSSMLISLLSNSLISDSISIQNYYRRIFRKQTQFIPYGAPNQMEYDKSFEEETLLKFFLEKNKYFLQITRFEPDNLPHDILEGFIKSDLSKKGYKMVLIGYKEPTDFSLMLKELGKNEGIFVLDAIYDKSILNVLRNNCCAYLHGNSVGGTNPALLEAMTTSPKIIAIDSEFSKEVLGKDYELLFNKDNIHLLFKKCAKESGEIDSKLIKRVYSHYCWEAVSESYIYLVENPKTWVDYKSIKNTLENNKS